MKVSKFILYILIVVSAVVMGLFYFGGGSEQALSASADADVFYVPNYTADADLFYVPNYTSLAINLAGLLLLLAVVAAVISALMGFVQAPKQSMKSLVGVGLFLFVFNLAFIVAYNRIYCDLIRNEAYKVSLKRDSKGRDRVT